MSSAESAPPTEPLILAERYRVIKPIGRGGMGAVFEAVHVLTGRRLAVKTLLAQYVNDAVLVERFMREARATTAIGDPHVIEIVDMGRTPEGDVFMVMELLDGRELKQAIRDDAPLPVERACHILHQIAAVMGRAHAIGVIHRDLKPANVFLVKRDRDPDYVKVLDFGIAKLDAAAHPDVASGQTMTRTGQIIGTPSYMSPEQLQGLKEIDARTDVYALGVMLYQSLAGRLPIKGESIPDIFLKVMTTEATPVESFRDDIPPELAAIVRRALSRDAAARYEHAGAMADALAPLAARWVIGSAPTVAGLTLQVRPDGPGGTSQSSSSGLSAPRVLTSAQLDAPPAEALRVSVSRRGALAAGVAALALLGAVVAWSPWRHEATPLAVVDRSADASPRAAIAAPEVTARPPQTEARDHADAEAPDVTTAAVADAVVAETSVVAAERVRPHVRPTTRVTTRRPEPTAPGPGEIMREQ